MMAMEDYQSVVLRSSATRTSNHPDCSTEAILQTTDVLLQRENAALLQEVVMRMKMTSQQRNGFKQVTLTDLDSADRVKEMSTLGEER